MARLEKANPIACFKKKIIRCGVDETERRLEKAHSIIL